MATKHERRKLRVIIITLGGYRQESMRSLFCDTDLQYSFEEPFFSPGVSSRSLRNRRQFFETAAAARLLPADEWRALQETFRDESTSQHELFRCLQDIPVTTANRKGSDYDIKLHYSVELWRKAKTLNRNRSVLACTLAHLIAMKHNFENSIHADLILEDNVRAPVSEMAERVWQAASASAEWESETGRTCQLRYLGWLGSRANLKWVLERHIPQQQFERKNGSRDPIDKVYGSVAPFPVTSDIRIDIEDSEPSEAGNLSPTKDQDDKYNKPGGTPVWGAYGYWISEQGYKALLESLQCDVGALLWKSKRMRFYQVKPIDKIMPRTLVSKFGQECVHISTLPTVFRGPMLTSRIHSQWDPAFCESTTYQLNQVALDWSDLWLTEEERHVVAHYKHTGEWITKTRAQLDGSG